MNPVSLAFRPSRTWLLDPVQFSERPEIEGVLHILVDGVDATADLGESRLDLVILELGEASIALAEGQGAAVITVGLPSSELVISRNGPSFLLSLIVQDPAYRLRLKEIEFDGALFLGAVDEAIEGFIADIQASGLRGTEELEKILDSMRRRITGIVGEGLNVATSSEGFRAQPAVKRSRPGPSKEIWCEYSLDETFGQEVVSGGGADLHHLLRDGKVSLLDHDSEELLGWPGPPFLIFRDLCRQVGELVSLWGAFDEKESLLQGAASTGGFLVEAFLAIPKAPEVVVSMLEAAIDYCDFQKECRGRIGESPYIEDLEEESRRLLSRFQGLIGGDHLGPPPPHAAAARGASKPTISRVPLSPHQLRRVNISRSWLTDTGPLLPGGFGFLGKGLLVAGDLGLQLLDLRDGRPVWSREEIDSVWLGPDRGSPILVSSAMGLELVTPTGATAWLAEALEAPPRSAQPYLFGRGSLVFSPDGRSVAAYSEADGRPLWRLDAPCGGRCVIAGGAAGVLLASDEGFLYAVDSDTGRLRWRLETRVDPGYLYLSSIGTVMVLGSGPSGPSWFTAEAATGE